VESGYRRRRATTTGGVEQQLRHDDTFIADLDALVMRERREGAAARRAEVVRVAA
jgi:hypothetical protein